MITILIFVIIVMFNVKGKEYVACAHLSHPAVLHHRQWSPSQGILNKQMRNLSNFWRNPSESHLLARSQCCQWIRRDWTVDLPWRSDCASALPPLLVVIVVITLVMVVISLVTKMMVVVGEWTKKEGRLSEEEGLLFQTLLTERCGKRFRIPYFFIHELRNCVDVPLEPHTRKKFP